MSDCDVCIGSNDHDSFDFSSTETPKARREHKCCECGRMIQRGEVYERVSGGYLGDMYRYRTCLLCVEIRDVFTCGKGWLYESLWDDMREYAFALISL